MGCAFGVALRVSGFDFGLQPLVCHGFLAVWQYRSCSCDNGDGSWGSVLDDGVLEKIPDDVKRLQEDGIQRGADRFNIVVVVLD